MKITLIHRREYEFESKDGEIISGSVYGGFAEDGSVVSFSSQFGEHKIFPKEVKFNSKNCEEILLESKFDEVKGKIKFREVTK